MGMGHNILTKIQNAVRSSLATVTQATNKTTGVTINAPAGKITMNAASMASGAEAKFTVTNSYVSATDNVLANHVSGGTSGTYMVGCSAVADGSFDLTVTNLTTGTPAEAIVIGFVIL